MFENYWLGGSCITGFLLPNAES